jgi:two-component system sensor histidine kinase KdpD
MDRGDIYPQERVERALQNFFRRGNLIALREMALQRVTRAVDRTLDDYVTRKQLSGHWQIAERVAVCISSNPESRDLIARGARLAEAINAEFFVLHVENELLEVPENRRRTLEANIQFAENVGARVVRLKGSSIATVTAEYVTRNRITQVIFGRSAIKGWKKYLYYLSLQRFMNDAPHVDVHLVTQQPA